MATEGDLGFWRWIAGVVLSALCGLLGGVWVTRGILKDLQHTDDDHGRRLGALEKFKEDQEVFCTQQKTELVNTLQREINTIVRTAISDMTIEQGEKLSKISISLAVQETMTTAIRADISDLSQRMNQMSGDNNLKKLNT